MFFLLLLVLGLIRRGQFICFVFLVIFRLERFFVLKLGMIGMLYCRMCFWVCVLLFMIWSVLIEGLMKMMLFFVYVFVSLMFLDRKLQLGWIVCVLVWWVVVIIVLMLRQDLVVGVGLIWMVILVLCMWGVVVLVLLQIVMLWMLSVCSVWMMCWVILL